MNCSIVTCAGSVDLNSPFTVQTTNMNQKETFPCNVCGRLHWKSGNGVVNGFGKIVFLKQGSVVIIEEDGKENVLRY